MPSPSIAIVGAGAIGTAVATRLAAAGARVTVVARGARAAQIAAHGLRLDDLAGHHEARPQLVERLAAPVSVLFLCVKSAALPAAVAANAAGIDTATRVVPMVNGIPWWFFGDKGLAIEAVDPGAQLHRAIPVEQIVGTVTNMTAAFTDAQGGVRSTIPHQLVLGPTVDAGPRPVDLAEVLTGAGFALNRADDVRPLVWEKLVLNLATNPLSALTGETLGEIAANPVSLTRAQAVANETERLAHAWGAPIDIAGSLPARLAAAGAFPTSMLQDARAGRPLETAPIVEAPLELARLRGVAMPETTRLRDELTARFAAAA